MRTRFLTHLWLLLFCVSGQAEAPSTELLFAPDGVDLTPSAGSKADKARLLRLKDGTLIVAWHEGVNTAHEAWGLDGIVHAPRCRSRMGVSMPERGVRAQTRVQGGGALPERQRPGGEVQLPEEPDLELSGPRPLSHERLAIVGIEGALEKLSAQWPAIRNRLDEPTVTEARQQYLRYALSIWEGCVAGSGLRNPASAVKSLDVICLLFDEK